MRYWRATRHAGPSHSDSSIWEQLQWRPSLAHIQTAPLHIDSSSNSSAGWRAVPMRSGMVLLYRPAGGGHPGIVCQRSAC